MVAGGRLLVADPWPSGVLFRDPTRETYTHPAHNGEVTGSNPVRPTLIGL